MVARRVGARLTPIKRGPGPGGRRYNHTDNVSRGAMPQDAAGDPKRHDECRAE